MSKIIVADSLMGSGKTSWCIDYINQKMDENILYISPYLDQDERIVKGCAENREFLMPINKGAGKLYSLSELLAGQSDIASTHELFKHMNDECRANIRDGGYTLILDEVLEVVQNYKTQKNDINILQESGCISIDQDGFVSWNEAKRDYDSKYNDIKLLAESHSLMCVNQTALIWRYPPEIFTLFDKVYILTYLFEASILKYYFDLYGISYEKMSVHGTEDGKYELCDFYEPDTTQFSQLIDVYDGKMNYSWKQKTSALSLNWYKNSSNKEHITQLKNNIYNYFQNILGAKSETILWTTFKDFAKKLQGKGYSRSFLSYNCRSSNEYADTYNLVYAVNVYLNPEILHFFNQKGIEINIDLYALSEMLQWIWRSRIRNGQKINIYVPSMRMRNLLLKWMAGEHFVAE